MVSVDKLTELVAGSLTVPGSEFENFAHSNWFDGCTVSFHGGGCTFSFFMNL